MNKGNTVHIDNVDIELSRLDKLFFPDDSISKGEVINYYRRVAELALLHAQDRPLSIQRFPDGISADGFFQKQVPDHFTDWIETVTSSKKSGNKITQVVAGNTATFVYLADQGMITPHVALSRIDMIDRPDHIIFDLDPSDDDFGKVQFAAGAIRDLCHELKLDSWVKTSGSRGLHI